MKKATVTKNLGKRHGIAGEIKTYNEQKHGAEKFKALVQEQV